MKLYKTFNFFVIFFAAISQIFAQQGSHENSVPQKIALVIGNGAYTSISPLKNPVNDANDIAAELRTLGFAVEVVRNGNLDHVMFFAAEKRL